MGDNALISSTGKLTREPVALVSAAPGNFINQVVNADCLTILPKIPSRSVDFVLTDPPYLANYRDRTGRSVAGDIDDAWLNPAFVQIHRVLKNNRFCVCFYGWPKVDRFFAAWRAAGFHPVGHLVWTKRYSSRKCFVGYQHEQAYLLAKGYPEKPETPLGDVLRWQYTDNRLHPTQKPVSGLLPLVEAFSRPGELVLDPFCGSGSSLLAAKQLGRNYIGIELDAGYCDIARLRL